MVPFIAAHADRPGLAEQQSVHLDSRDRLGARESGLIVLTALAVASSSSKVWGTGRFLATRASLLMNKVTASEVIGKA